MPILMHYLYYGDTLGSWVYIWKSEDSGGSFTHKFLGSAGIGKILPNRPFVMDPLDGQKIYVGGHNLGRTLNGGNNWNSIQVPSYVYEDATCQALAVALSDTGIIFMAYRDPIYNNVVTTVIDTVKFIKRENGNWINLTYRVNAQHPYLRCYGITDIAISNTNHDSVWISFGGFNNQWNPARVLFSADGGMTWADYSEALPDMPVNRILYHNNSNGGLFVGTDAGVFYRDNTLPEWQPFNYNLPQAIVLDLEINDSLQLLRAGTFGRGIYETDISCHFSEDPLVIGSDTTWRTLIEMDRSIEIDSGATLTIQGTVKLPTRAKIFVKQGAKLILDGGTLTNKCFYNWQGIEVWGSSDLPQWPVSNQGFVWMKNGAVLENSRIGISTCKTYPDGRIIWNTTGGLIVADSAYFLNNYNNTPVKI
jgi:hypothetical protein